MAPLEAGDHLVERVEGGDAAGVGSGSVPCGEESGERLGWSGLDLAPEGRQRSAPQPPQDLGVDPLGDPGSAAGPELTLHHAPRCREAAERSLDHRDPETETGGDVIRHERPVSAGEACDEVADRVVHRLDIRRREADRQRSPQGISHARRVFDRDHTLRACDPHLDGAPRSHEFGHPSGGRSGLDRPVRDLGHRQVTQRTKHVVDVVRVARLAIIGQALQFELQRRQRSVIDQLPQFVATEQLGEQGAVERQRLRAALGQRRVALVHERRDESEQQGRGERRGHRGVDLDDPHLALRDRSHQILQRGKIEDVLQTLPVSLENDRELPVATRHLEECG